MPSVLVAALAIQESPAGGGQWALAPCCNCTKDKRQGSWSAFVVTAPDKQNKDKGGTKDGRQSKEKGSEG